MCEIFILFIYSFLNKFLLIFYLNYNIEINTKTNWVVLLGYFNLANKCIQTHKVVISLGPNAGTSDGVKGFLS